VRALVLVVVAGCGRLGFDDGATRDGAPADGVGDGAGGDVVPVECSPAFDLCDGFEAGLDLATWTVDTGVTLDTSKAHRGAASVRVAVPAFGAGQSVYRGLLEDRTFATAGTAIWMRGWFWLDALPAGDNGMELVTVERVGVAGDFVFVRSNRTTVYSQFDGQVRSVDAPAPVGSWFCVVFEIVRSTTSTGSLSVTGDLPNVALGSVTTDGAQAINVATFGAGFASSNVTSAQPALDLWIDDVIVHSAPVTCAD
jgi:hypothetical protein